MCNIYIYRPTDRLKKQYDKDMGKSSISDVKLPTSITWKVTQISLLTNWNLQPTWRCLSGCQYQSAIRVWFRRTNRSRHCGVNLYIQSYRSCFAWLIRSTSSNKIWEGMPNTVQTLLNRLRFTVHSLPSNIKENYALAGNCANLSVIFLLRKRWLNVRLYN